MVLVDGRIIPFLRELGRATSMCINCMDSQFTNLQCYISKVVLYIDNIEQMEKKCKICLKLLF